MCVNLPPVCGSRAVTVSDGGGLISGGGMPKAELGRCTSQSSSKLATGEGGFAQGQPVQPTVCTEK